jgi:hypothetical protein
MSCARAEERAPTCRFVLGVIARGAEHGKPFPARQSLLGKFAAKTFGHYRCRLAAKLLILKADSRSIRSASG